MKLLREGNLKCINRLYNKLQMDASKMQLLPFVCVQGKF